MSKLPTGPFHGQDREECNGCSCGRPQLWWGGQKGSSHLYDIDGNKVKIRACIMDSEMPYFLIWSLYIQRLVHHEVYGISRLVLSLGLFIKSLAVPFLIIIFMKFFIYLSTFIFITSDNYKIYFGTALRANVGGRIGNRVSPAESAFSASFGSGSSRLPGRGLVSEPCIGMVSGPIRYGTRYSATRHLLLRCIYYAVGFALSAFHYCTSDPFGPQVSPRYVQTQPAGSGIESVQLSQLVSDRDRVVYLGVARSASHYSSSVAFLWYNIQASWIASEIHREMSSLIAVVKSHLFLALVHSLSI